MDFFSYLLNPLRFFSELDSFLTHSFCDLPLILFNGTMGHESRIDYLPLY